MSADEKKTVKKTLTIPAWLNELAEEADVQFSRLLRYALMTKLDVHSYEEYCQMKKGAVMVTVFRCKNCGWYDEDTGICDFWGEPRHPEHFCEEGRPRE